MSAKYELLYCTDCSCERLSGAPGSDKYKETYCPKCFGIGKVPDNPNPVWSVACEFMSGKFSRSEVDQTIELEEGSFAHTVWEARREKALRLLKKGTAESWSTIKSRIWERDEGICQVCGFDLRQDPDSYELGHKVDRVCGGSDTDDNLCVQCVACNRLKPPHDTWEEYEEWIAGGGWRGEIAQYSNGEKT